MNGRKWRQIPYKKSSLFIRKKDCFFVGYPKFFWPFLFWSGSRLFCAYLKVLTKKVDSKPQKYLISPIIERIRKWRSEAKEYSNKIEKLQEKARFTAVSSNSSLVLEGGAILENVETGSRIPELQDCQNNKDLTTVNWIWLML